MLVTKEKYFRSDTGQKNKIEDLLTEDEEILWEGKPNKKSYVLASLFRMFPFVLIWLLFDGIFLGVMFGMGGFAIPWYLILFIVVFFILHLTPVWIWLVNLLTSGKQVSNLHYVFTSQRIIIRSGVIGIDYANLYYVDIQSVNLKVGWIDRLFKVGDIYITASKKAQVLWDLSDPYYIVNQLQKIIHDIKTDVYFPNDLRPKENKGYKTKYRP